MTTSKSALPTRDRYIANYQQTIRNLARFGVKVICYNFMPVFDWMKTDMNYVLPDGSLTMAFEKKDIDKRLEDVVKEVLENSNGFALPGWEPERLAEVQTLFAKYSAVDDQKLRENLVYFLQAVIPVCEEVGVKMAIHPDDPPYSILACRGWSKPRRSGLDLPGRRFTRQRHYALHRLDCRRS
ncbi:mannonate dehydratase [Klebsiella pneumoniae]|uniref:Mannonate dehydratase n=1 Tax=Klebsiella pneumoniae TaxID=573 RepID=A0A4P0YH99_KLEPN|nr:mannonate dehydratase [Klebsiella pneumoniae]